MALRRASFPPPRGRRRSSAVAADAAEEDDDTPRSARPAGRRPNPFDVESVPRWDGAQLQAWLDSLALGQYGPRFCELRLFNVLDLTAQDLTDPDRIAMDCSRDRVRLARAAATLKRQWDARCLSPPPQPGRSVLSPLRIADSAGEAQALAEAPEQAQGEPEQAQGEPEQAQGEPEQAQGEQEQWASPRAQLEAAKPGVNPPAEDGEIERDENEIAEKPRRVEEPEPGLRTDGTAEGLEGAPVSGGLPEGENNM